MKPRLACLLTLLLVLFSLSHVEGGQDKIDSATDLQGKTIAAVLPPVPTKNVEASIANAIGGKPKEVQYFNRFSDCVLALKSGKADAVLCASIFHYGHYTVEQAKEHMASHQIPVRV